MLSLIGTFVGGIGLFLLGMRLMTDGLKTAAGDALRNILGHWTRTPLRGLFSGFLITTLVQSSSAVTVATIGFVNAGLLTLAQSIGVIYGSNLGTTMTGWLVVLVGFKVDIQALALPLIGIGTALELSGRGRTRPVGQALIGFGLFFLGVAVLKEAFQDLGASVPLGEMFSPGFAGTLMFVGIGALLTLLMQSSSAAIALVLTAAAGDVIPLHAAAATVIGANVGTTSTAAFAVIGATSNAKRAAAAHVLFNALTAVAALLILPLLLATLPVAVEALGLATGPATLLAVFHTVFKLLGIGLLWPFTPRLVVWLEAHFRRGDEDEARPKFLDKNVLVTPRLAIDAIVLELSGIEKIAREMARRCLSSDRLRSEQLAGDLKAVRARVEAVNDFTTRLQKAELPAEIVEAIPNLLRIARYHRRVAEMTVQLAEARERLEPLNDPILEEALIRFLDSAARLLAIEPDRPEGDTTEIEHAFQSMVEQYQILKAQLLRAGADGRLKVRRMVAYLDEFSILRRLLEQSVKGTRHLSEVWQLAARYQPEKSVEAAEAGESDASTENVT